MVSYFYGSFPAFYASPGMPPSHIAIPKRADAEFNRRREVSVAWNAC
jgi:hypothetical protein